MKGKVCKFGGSSSACKTGVQNILKILKDASRKIIISMVVLLNQKRDTKLTDLLIELHSGKNVIDKINQKLQALAKNLNINFNVKKHTQKLRHTKNYNKLLSRGEFLTAKMFSKASKIKFIDAKIILKCKKNKFNSKKIGKKISKYIKKYHKIIVPGFYFWDKKIKLFSRGGGDVSGAYLALFSAASAYEIWTDVEGVYTKNPQQSGAKIIKKLTYKTMQKMAKNGAQVVHPDACQILKNSGIPSIVKSTFRPSSPGTKII